MCDGTLRINMLQAKKRFGQNFLTDDRAINNIIGSMNIKAGDHIIEIGSGRGALTQPLADSRCHLTLIEIDRSLATELLARFPNAKLINKDVMAIDFNQFSKESSVRIVGNLPYNISTPLLFKLFELGENIDDMHFMLQREVVNRMIAKPSTKTYGRLSVMTQLYCTTKKLFEVPPESFSPQPKVHSAVIRLTPNDKSTDLPKKVLERILIQAFSMRRKTIRNALRPFFSQKDLLSLNLDPQLRPENLTIDEYLSCAKFVEKRQ